MNYSLKNEAIKVLVGLGAAYTKLYAKIFYPYHVPHYEVRKDVYTNETVTPGRFELLGGLIPNNKLDEKVNSVPLQEFRRILQCSQNVATLNGNRGSLSFLKMIPPTKEIVELMCVWFETRLSWMECQKRLHSFRNGDYNKNLRERNRLMRIINGSLFMDWPWGTDRFTSPYLSMTSILFYVTAMISDLKDVVFFLDAEIGTLPWYIPFPVFTNSPSINNVDMPWPWYESLRTELQIYRELKKSGLDMHNHGNYHQLFTTAKFVEWNNRTAKAAYYGELLHIRQLFFDQALSRPDLLDVGFTCAICGIDGLDPSCKDQHMPENAHDARMSTNRFRGSGNDIKHGTAYQLSKFYIKDPIHYHEFLPGRYKYLVVLTGINALATSGRLAQFLAHTGAVILLQHNSFDYHFSSELKPWVHYVPLAYNGADIIEKIEWLQQHDKMAHRIAQNGMNFGRSYLRLEDQMCYVANALDIIANVIKDEGALIPFNATQITAESYHSPIP